MKKLILLCFFCANLFPYQLSAQNKSDAIASDWKKENTYTLAVQAYIYGFPYVYLSEIRYSWTNSTKDTIHSPSAPINSFWHASVLADASYKSGGNPNNDTYYSIAILDLRKGPVILEHPDMGSRYFTFELADMSSDNFDYVGKRTTGGKAGKFLIYYKDWKGKVPAGVKELAPSPTPWVFVFGRTLVDNAKDSKAALDLMHQFKLTPYDNYMSGKPFVATDRKSAWMPYNPKTDSLADWKTMMRSMAENPTPIKDKPLMDLFSTIGLVPGTNIDSLDNTTKAILVKAAKMGKEILDGANKSGLGSKQGNNWFVPSVNMGRAGAHNEYLFRGAVQCLGGIISNDPQEAVYIYTTKDGNGDVLDGNNNSYQIHFSKDQMPKVDGFWSLTMYGMDYNLVDNPINRYSIGDRTPNVKKDADGGLTIYIQKDAPGKDKVSNWLPSPNGKFSLILRCYIPDKSIYEQGWYPPAINKLK